MMMNNLIGVLMRFRKENVAVMCDVEQMCHSFHVHLAHRNFLHFLWFEGNDPSKPITEYRMNVHLFGNGPSPAVATYRLRRTTVDDDKKYGEEAKNFICRNCYVDEGLASLTTAQGAIDLVKGAQATIATPPLRIEQKTCVTSTCAATACPRNGRYEFSGIWRRMPSPSRCVHRRNHSPG